MKQPCWPQVRDGGILVEDKAIEAWAEGFNQRKAKDCLGVRVPPHLSGQGDGASKLVWMKSCAGASFGNANWNRSAFADKNGAWQADARHVNLSRSAEAQPDRTHEQGGAGGLRRQ